MVIAAFGKGPVGPTGAGQGAVDIFISFSVLRLPHSKYCRSIGSRVTQLGVTEFGGGLGLSVITVNPALSAVSLVPVNIFSFEI